MYSELSSGRKSWFMSDGKLAQLKLVLHDAIFLATYLAMLKKKSIASCRRHVTRCNLGLQVAMDSKHAIVAKRRTELHN